MVEGWEAINVNPSQIEGMALAEKVRGRRKDTGGVRPSP
ncbi:hypothetical protein LCGC14_1782580 [marine sediment metagenome]|uniref:Uncharacterized protein n=1 Tax=marine sediment metagenome TaxID=412755 RepID=A0A0F9HHJ6_9ZZZZ